MQREALRGRSRAEEARAKGLCTTNDGTEEIDEGYKRI